MLSCSNKQGITRVAWKKAIKIIGWVVLLIIAGLAIAWFGFLKPEPLPVSPEERAQITLMPLPSEMKLKKSVFVLSEDIMEVIEYAADRGIRVVPEFDLPGHTTPLNRIVDAARPESYIAYRFSQDVDLWIKVADQAARSGIMQSLEAWSVNHEQLAPAFEGSDRLKEVEAHSKNLSSLVKIGLEALPDPRSLKGRASELDVLFNSAAGPHGGTILSLVEPVKKLVENAAEN